MKLNAIHTWGAGILKKKNRLWMRIIHINNDCTVLHHRTANRFPRRRMFFFGRSQSSISHSIRSILKWVWLIIIIVMNEWHGNACISFRRARDRERCSTQTSKYAKFGHFIYFCVGDSVCQISQIESHEEVDIQNNWSKRK